MNSIKAIRFFSLLLALMFLMSFQSAALSESSASTPDEAKIMEVSSQIAELETQIQNLTAQKLELEKELIQLRGNDESNGILFDYKALSRNPDKYIGSKSSFSGTIVQVSEDNYFNEVTFRIATKSSSGDVVYATYEKSDNYSRFLDDDKVYVTGVYEGLKTYETIFGGSVTIPSFSIEKIGLITDDESPYSVNVDDFDIQTYMWATSRYNYCAFEILSNASVPVSLDIAVRYYDKNGNLTGVSNDTVDVIGPNEQTIVITSNDEAFAKVEYDVTPNTAPRYRSPLADFSYNLTKASKKVIVELKNNGDAPARFVEGYVLFLSKGKIVDYDWKYFTDSDNEIKPGKTIYKEFSTSSKFDDVRVYFTGQIRN